MLKSWPLPHTVCVCVCVCMLVVGGGGSRRYYITIRTSIMTPLSATVLRMSTARGVGGWRGGGGGQWLQMYFTLTTRIGICVPYITMEISTNVN